MEQGWANEANVRGHQGMYAPNGGLEADDDDTPSWLVEAADECGVPLDDASSPGSCTPPSEGMPTKRILRLSELARVVKQTGTSQPPQPAMARKKVVFDPMTELRYVKDELAGMQRSHALQARMIETLKEKNEVLEQRLALRDYEISCQ